MSKLGLTAEKIDIESNFLTESYRKNEIEVNSDLPLLEPALQGMGAPKAQAVKFTFRNATYRWS